MLSPVVLVLSAATHEKEDVILLVKGILRATLLHIVADATLVIIGVGFTVTVTVCGALLQPLVVPITVYVVVPGGVTVVALVIAPLLHT